MPMHKVLITTSGTGSRLGELTKNLNKCLIEIGGKPAIEHIFNCYPEDTVFHITLGYLGDEVKNYLNNYYPDKTFKFHLVDRYQGPGSSLGYSMLAAKDALQEPFIFHCCDTIIGEKVPLPEENWSAGFSVDNPDQYRTLEINSGKIININNKKEGTSKLAHIGLIGIKDYKSFWENLANIYENNPNDETLNDTYVINNMINNNVDFNIWEVGEWLDTGNLEALAITRKKLEEMNE